MPSLVKQDLSKMDSKGSNWYAISIIDLEEVHNLSYYSGKNIAL